MEYLCSYCNKPFLPKRTDSLYCSHSCRQFAYVLRKSTKESVNDFSLGKVILSKEKTSETTGESEKNNLSEIQHPSKPEELKEIINGTNIETANLSVKTVKELAVNTETELSVKTDKQRIDPPITTPIVTENKTEAIKSDYDDHASRYVMQLDRLHAERDVWYSLSKFFDEADESGMWVSERYRCLIDVLLTFSEMKRIELDDLKEVCNAFTDVIKSDYYQCLHHCYPYTQEIKKLRDQIKATCITTSREQFKYRISREHKQNLIVSRFELSQFVGKSKFSELKFKDK